jgi:VanZ family protein
MVFVRMAIPEERTHLIEYGVVAVFIHEALIERNKQGRRVRFPALYAVLATALVGALDEGIQEILPSRVFDLRDILFNFLAGFMAVTGNLALRWARRWNRRRKQVE